MLVQRLKKYIDKFLRLVVSHETYFKIKYEKKVQLELNDWSVVKPDSAIGKFDVIECGPEFREISENLHMEGRMCCSVREMWNIHNLVKKTGHVKGDIIEVGVFNGGTAKLIAKTKKHKKLHLFDTFEGMPDSVEESDKLSKGDIRGGALEEVRKYVNDHDTYLYKGIFPESGKFLENTNTALSFVHLDVDIYSSTLESLRFVYPLMSKGGIILTHDYRTKHLPGVRRAFDEFFSDKPEMIIELWDTQAMIVKV